MLRGLRNEPEPAPPEYPQTLIVPIEVATEAVDSRGLRCERYPRPISNMVGMPADFASGVSAAVDGDGRFVQFGYLFREDHYLRFQWVPAGSGQPHVDGTSTRIHKTWPGLVELLLAGKAKAKALVWIRAAQAALAAAAGGGFTPLVNAALSTHFHISPGLSLAVPAYTFLGRNMNFTEHFAERRRMARAAIVLHEAVHFTDATSGTRTATGALAIDIPEWYVSDAQANALGLPVQPNRDDLAVRYDAMNTTQAVHNPSAYAAFAQHIAIGSDTRFGDANQGPE
jgi:hypothetical protein